MAANINLENFRNLMHQHSIDAYIIPMSDPHMSEYMAEHWRIIKWFCGFTGSAGNVVVTQNFAGLWTDSRYFTQAATQLKNTGVELVKLNIAHTPEYIDWIAENLPSGSSVAFDGKIFPIKLVKYMEEKLIHKEMKMIPDVDFISELWLQRPPIPQSKVFIHDIKYAGKSSQEKLFEIRAEMNIENTNYLVISSLDDIAWTFNIRGKDISYVPLVICFSIITQSEAILFIDENKLTPEVLEYLDEQGIIIKPYFEIFNYLNNIKSGKSASIQFSKTSYGIYNAIPKKCQISDSLNISSKLKAVKNDVEISNINETMVKDGVAMVKYLYWLNETMGKEKITEISASEKLRSFRGGQIDFFDESFSPISAFNANAAMPHYSATPETDAELKIPGIYLIDSGGQYFGGTTDITRTIALGMPTNQQKTDFTLALKGTIGLAMAIFPYGTKGYQLDVLARKHLWNNGLNFGHGTGHGVGYFLNVHEGPQTIGTSASGDINTILQVGMLTSIEPAFYRDGQYGFRTENLILVVEHEVTDYGRFLKFETVTLCPIDLNLIDIELLDKNEVEWLNNYHKNVYNKISGFLTVDEKNWLKENTKAIH